MDSDTIVYLYKTSILTIVTSSKAALAPSSFKEVLMIKEIPMDKLQEMLDHGAELIDVREEEEVTKTGPIDECAKHWPLSTFGLRQDEVSKQRPTIFYCHSGLRSMKAAEIAENWTEQDLYTLQGGLLNSNLFKNC